MFDRIVRPLSSVVLPKNSVSSRSVVLMRAITAFPPLGLLLIRMTPSTAPL